MLPVNNNFFYFVSSFIFLIRGFYFWNWPIYFTSKYYLIAESVKIINDHKRLILALQIRLFCFYNVTVTREYIYV
jgi:hypothetical protein